MSNKDTAPVAFPRAGYSPRETALALGISEASVRQRIHRGSIPSVRVGTSVHVPGRWLELVREGGLPDLAPRRRRMPAPKSLIEWSSTQLAATSGATGGEAPTTTELYEAYREWAAGRGELASRQAFVAALEACGCRITPRTTRRRQDGSYIAGRFVEGVHLRPSAPEVTERG